MSTQSTTGTVIAPGGGQTYSVVGDIMTIKIAGAQTRGAFGLAETIVPPNGGPPPHIHRREDELFYVLDGTLDFTFRDTTFRGGPGTAVYLPKGIIHTFKNNNDRPARFLVAATPSGFETFVATAGCACLDPAAPPAITPAHFETLMRACAEYQIEMYPEHRADQPAAPRPADRAFWVLGEHVRLKLTGADTGGNFSVAEITSRPGGGVPPHLHHATDEFFYVLDGTYEFEVDGHPVAAPAGTTVYVPRGTLHGFRNTGSAPARLLDYHTPAAFEAFFEEAGTPCGVDDWRSGTPAPMPEMGRVMELIRKHGMEMPPPPR